MLHQFGYTQNNYLASLGQIAIPRSEATTDRTLQGGNIRENNIIYLHLLSLTYFILIIFMILKIKRNINVTQTRTIVRT